MNIKEVKINVEPISIYERNKIMIRINPRERFLKTMKFGNPDRVVYWEDTYWYESTLKRWRKEGLQKDIDPWHYFAFDPKKEVQVDAGFIPSFKKKIIFEDNVYITMSNAAGIVSRYRKDMPLPAMPQFIDFPVKKKEDFTALKKRLNSNNDKRYEGFNNKVPLYNEEREYPLGIRTASFFGTLREWMGTENACMVFYDDPTWVHEMMEFITEYYLDILKKVLGKVKLDYAWFWEDMAYKCGSFISPDMVRKFIMPGYKKITSFLRENGVDIIMVDSDGNVSELIPLWLESGINCVYPMEVAAGMDVIKLRKEYGKDLLIIGGIDKRELSKGKTEIDKEVIPKVSYLIEKGGYIPSIDHAIPPDISFENFCYYRNLIKKLCGDK